MWRRETWSFKFEWTHPIHRYCISVWTVSHSFLVVLQKCPGIIFVFLFHCFFSLHSTPLWMKNYLQHWIAKFKITVLKLKVTISSVDLTANSNSTIASFLQLEKKKNHILLQLVLQTKVYSNPTAVSNVRKNEFVEINGYVDWIRTSNDVAVLWVM